jgi:hypothetical protein
MTSHTTDYLIIGAGATGLAFADTLLQESDAHITLVDLHAQPGGHWNDAYPFVALHQPSAFYGVNSLELGILRKDTAGHNAGLYELASGAEVSSYFHKVMHQLLLPSGRVRYLPMTKHLVHEAGVSSVASILSGEQERITVRKKMVDATYFSPQVPATTPPAFAVAEGVRLVTPTQLTQVWRGQEHFQNYCVIGAGKTAMDAVIFLLTRGAAPDQIHWVMPRDSWLVNRLSTQPGEEFFLHSMGGATAQMKAIALATSVDDMYARLEASKQMLRIDRSRKPEMFHYATISEEEVALLRQVTHVIRQGRVQAIETEALVFAPGKHTMPKHTLYINCTASAVKPKASEPMFQPGKIVPQLSRAPLISFSAALCAYVEAHYTSDEEKNALCTPVPFPRNPAGFIASTMTNAANQMRWGQDKTLRAWMRESRLDGFGKLASTVRPTDTEKMAILVQLKEYSMGAASNAKRLMQVG